MNNKEQVNHNFDIWLTVAEAAELLNMKRRSVRKKCNNNIYITKMINGKYGNEYKILLSSLPPVAQKKYEKASNHAQGPGWPGSESKNILGTPALLKNTPVTPVHGPGSESNGPGSDSIPRPSPKTIINKGEVNDFDKNMGPGYPVNRPRPPRPFVGMTGIEPRSYPSNQPLIEKIYQSLSHPLIWGPDGIMPLKKFKANSGGFTASCPNPAHEDKNPSFLMKEGLPVGKCQSCGYSLRWFDAIALSLGHKTTVKGKDYWKVIDTLSGLTGEHYYELTTEEKEKYELIHEVQELNNTLSKYLHKQLLENPWGEYTRKYLESRGIEKKYLSKFSMLGFYPQTETIEQFLISEGFSLEAIQEANVLFKYFQNQCLIFSYKDELGNTLGFKGRKPNTKTIRYQKGFKGELRNKAVMGLEACNTIIERGRRIICVEGEFDWLRAQAQALKLHDGTGEFVCFGGSDIKKEKLETLKKAGAEVLYLSFDPDTAGKKATRDTIKHSEEFALCCFIMELPTGYDPDKYIETYGLPAYQKIFKSACKPSEWLSKEFLNKFTLNNKEGLERAKIALLEEAKQYKGLLLEAFLEETTKELSLDKNYTLDLIKKQQQESAKGMALFTLKSFLPDAPVNEDFIIPIGWALDNQGLTKIKETKNDIQEIPVAAAPFFVSSRSSNIDNKQEKLELSYLRDEKWKTIL